MAHDHETISGTANLRDVWTIASEALREKHYAAFPSELVYRCLAAGTSSKGYCASCGMPWTRIVERKASASPSSHRGSSFLSGKTGVNGDGRNGDGDRTEETETIGWRASCKCQLAEPRPGLVLDPFAGSGRTAIQANRLGHEFVGVELNPQYVEMANRLIYDANPLFSGVTP